jgi:hypothetical protein
VQREIASDMSVNFFDFAAVFPEDKRYYTDGQHMTEEGVIHKAGLFADYLVDNKLIPSK